MHYVKTAVCKRPLGKLIIFERATNDHSFTTSSNGAKVSISSENPIHTSRLKCKQDMKIYYRPYRYHNQFQYRTNSVPMCSQAVQQNRIRSRIQRSHVRTPLRPTGIRSSQRGEGWVHTLFIYFTCVTALLPPTNGACALSCKKHMIAF